MPTPSPEHLFNAAVRQHESGNLAEAEALYRKVLREQPGHPAAANNLANALYARGEMRLAIAAYRDAVSHRPDFVEAWANLSGALRRNGEYEEAVEAARRALALRPNYALVHLSLAEALYALGRYSEAMASYRQALAWRNHYPEAHVGLGLCFFAQRRIDDAIAAYRNAISQRKDFALAHFNLGLALLIKGDFAAGLPEWEWRWKAPELGVPKRKFPQPLWAGTSPAGKTLLIHAEQGIGDTIQFARYLPLVAQGGGRIILYCQTELRRLLSNIPGVESTPSPGDDIGHVDFHCPLLSLPLIMGTTLETIPVMVPYISPDSALVQQWRNRLPADGKKKIGLVWGGRPQNTKNNTRSVTLAAMARLADAPNTAFYSLQKGPPASEAASPPPKLNLINYTEELNDFADTAALISALDMVVAVDTAVAHLAGAMGKPVCVLLSYTADWRWFLDRDDSPWYRTARLFRQPHPDDWRTPIEDVLLSLTAFAKI